MTDRTKPVTGPRHAAARSRPAESPPGRVGRAGRARWPLVVAVVVVAVLFVGVFPTRTYFAQRAAIARAEEQLTILSQENQRLEDRVDALNTPDEIERMAREEFELVYPGERPYVVLPAADPAVTLPRAWPFGGLADAFSAAEAAPPG